MRWRRQWWSCGRMAVLLLLLLTGQVLGAEEGQGDALPEAGVAAQGDGLSVQFHVARVQRLQGPLPVAITLQGSSDAPRTGTVLLTLGDGSRDVICWRSPVWTVTSTPRTVECLLPPLALTRGDALQATVAWEEDGQRRPLSPIRLTTGGLRDRPLILAWCQGTRGDTFAMRRLTSLDGLFATASDRTWHPDIRVTISPLSPEQAPADALAWCAVDAAAFSADGLDRLGEHQLRALEQWVAGGGSVVVMADGEQLSPPAAAFLQDLGTLGGCRLATPPGILDTHVPILAEVGLGRCAIVPLSLGRAAPPAEAAGIGPFIWRIRLPLCTAYLHGAPLDPQALARTAEQAQTSVYYRARTRTPNDGSPGISFMPEPDSQLQASLPQLLMPSGIGTVPFGLVATIIVIFALAIGPGDWLLLGYFRAHRYTWILFPVLSVLCTVVLMAIANRYLGSHEHRTHLVVVDVGAQGRVLRSDRIEEVFTGHAGTVQTQVADSLWVPLGSDGNGFGRAPTADDVVPPLYDGGMPTRYTATTAVQQWAPALRRSLSFAPLPVPILPEGDLTDATQAGAIADRMVAAHPGCVVGVVRGHSHLEILRGTLRTLVLNGQQSATPDWLDHLCCAPQRGWFTLASQLSPTGGDALEDVPVMDPDDPSRCMLVVAYISGDTIYVVRRIYALATPAAPAAKDHA